MFTKTHATLPSMLKTSGHSWMQCSHPMQSFSSTIAVIAHPHASAQREAEQGALGYDAR
jgi:hypothetical protein